VPILRRAECSWAFPGKAPNEPTATTPPCPHVVFVSVTAYPAAEYVHHEFYIEFGKRPGSNGLEAELMRILNTHFRFIGPVTFAPTENPREAARREVADFLRAQRL